MRRDASSAEGTATETDSNAITFSAELIDGNLRSSDLWCGYAESDVIASERTVYIKIQK